MKPGIEKKRGNGDQTNRDDKSGGVNNYHQRGVKCGLRIEGPRGSGRAAIFGLARTVFTDCGLVEGDRGASMRRIAAGIRDALCAQNRVWEPSGGGAGSDILGL